jgi:hypothetical protein
LSALFSLPGAAPSPALARSWGGLAVYGRSPSKCLPPGVGDRQPRHLDPPPPAHIARRPRSGQRRASAAPGAGRPPKPRCGLTALGPSLSLGLLLPVRTRVGIDDAAPGGHHARPERWHWHVIGPRVRIQGSSGGGGTASDTASDRTPLARMLPKRAVASQSDCGGLWPIVAVDRLFCFCSISAMAARIRGIFGAPKLA